MPAEMGVLVLVLLMEPLKDPISDQRNSNLLCTDGHHGNLSIDRKSVV